VDDVEHISPGQAWTSALSRASSRLARKRALDHLRVARTAEVWLDHQQTGEVDLSLERRYGTGLAGHAVARMAFRWARDGWRIS